MGINMKYEIANEHLTVRVSGRFDLDEMRKSFLEMLKIMDTGKASKVLVDCFQLKGNPSAADRYFYAKFGADELWKFLRAKKMSEVQFAYVGTEPLIAKDGFGQTVAINRGVNVKNFDNIDDALMWLGDGSKNK